MTNKIVNVELAKTVEGCAFLWYIEKKKLDQMRTDPLDEHEFAIQAAQTEAALIRLEARIDEWYESNTVPLRVPHDLAVSPPDSGASEAVHSAS